MRSCDPVSAGAFFSQAEFQAPQKEMSQHTHQHMMVPSGILAHFIMVHTHLTLTCFKTLLNRSATTTQPDKRAQRRAPRGITDGRRIAGLGSQAPLHHQPHGSIRQPPFRQGYTLASKLILEGALGPFRDAPSIPTRSR